MFVALVVIDVFNCLVDCFVVLDLLLLFCLFLFVLCFCCVVYSCLIAGWLLCYFF